MSAQASEADMLGTAAQRPRERTRLTRASGDRHSIFVVAYSANLIPDLGVEVGLL